MSLNCIFCKIAKKEIPANVVFENDEVIAFDDISPAAPVHVVIIPKKHIENVMVIDDSNKICVASIHIAAIEVAKLKGITDFRLITNNGKEAGQTVFHLHYHLIGGKILGGLI